ncbi:MAG: signal transduction histidine kinase/CheY-like chemotaxis protein [Burkholderiaceae bacterium]|jgi:signal transduction histidine kinase/CheY-like chemotaxis protein
MIDATPPAITPASTPQRRPLAAKIRMTWLDRLRAGDMDTIYQLFIGLVIGNAVIFSCLSWLGLGPVGTYWNTLWAAFVLLVLVANRQQFLSREKTAWLLIGSGYIHITIKVVTFGGMWSPVLPWYIMLPLPVLYLFGLRPMIAVVSWTLATVLAIALAQSHDLLPEFHPANSTLVWAFMVFTGLALAIAMLPILYHFMHSAMVNGLNEKNLELQRIRDQLMSEQLQKDNFLASVSHELRTPMNAIIGFLQAIEQRPTGDAQTQEMHGYMSHSAKHLMTTINDLLDLSQMRAGKLNIAPRQVDLPKLVSDISNTFKPQLDERGIQLRVTIDDNVSKWVMLDSDRLSQVLINLLGNAAKFTQKGGVSIYVSQAGLAVVRFEVSDTGRGIAAHQLSRVFDRYSDITNSTRRAYGGTGLGLSICRQLIKLQGGDIGVFSQLGQGATFWFELPLETCEPLAKLNTGSQDTPVLDGHHAYARVLIVDDSFINRLVAKKLLLSDLPDLQITEADSAQAALDALASQRFDLILMDVVMPVKDGIETTTHIRTTDQKITIIGLTADVTTDVRTRCLDAGMNDVITKPFERQVLVNRVKLGIASSYAD